jgi:hypothetical protein
VRDSSRIEYSLTNRVRGRTVAPANTEAARLEVLRFLVGHSIDLNDEQRRSGDVLGDLLLEPRQGLRLRGTVRHDTHGEGVQSVNSDVSADVKPVAVSAGWRYFRPDHLSFLQGTANVEVHRNVIARLVTHWDLRANRFVENRYAVDLRFQCYAITVEYVDRSRQSGRGGDDEVRFAVNLLGIGGPIQSSLGLGSLTSGGGASGTSR